MDSSTRGCPVTRHPNTPGSAAERALGVFLDSPSATHETWVTAPVDVTSRDADPDYESPESLSSHASSEEPEFVRAARAVAKRNAALRRTERNASSSRDASQELSTPASQQSVGMQRGAPSSSTGHGGGNGGASSDEGAAMLQSIIRRASERLHRMGKSQEHKTAEQMLEELRGSGSGGKKGGVEGQARAKRSSESGELRAAGRVESPARSRASAGKVKEWLHGSESPSSSTPKASPSEAPAAGRGDGQVTMLDLIHRAAARLEALQGAGEVKSAEMLLKELKDLPCPATQGDSEVHVLDGEQLEAVVRSYAPSESDFGAPSEASTTLEELMAAAGSHHRDHKSAVALLKELKAYSKGKRDAADHVPQGAPHTMSNGSPCGAAHATRSNTATGNGGTLLNGEVCSSAGNSIHAPGAVTLAHSPRTTACEADDAQALPSADSHKSSDQVLRELKEQGAGQQASAGGAGYSDAAGQQVFPNPARPVSSSPATNDVWSEDISEASTSIDELVATQTAQLSGNFKSADELLGELKSHVATRKTLSSPERQDGVDGLQGSDVTPVSELSETASHLDTTLHTSGGSDQLLPDHVLPLGNGHMSANELLCEVKGEAASKGLSSGGSGSGSVTEEQPECSNIGSCLHPPRGNSGNAMPPQHSPSMPTDFSHGRHFQDAYEHAVPSMKGAVATDIKSALTVDPQALSPESESAGDTASEASTAAGQLLAERVDPLAGNYKSAIDLLKELKGGAAIMQQKAIAVRIAPSMHQPVASVCESSLALQRQTSLTENNITPNSHSMPLESGTLPGNLATCFNDAVERTYRGGMHDIETARASIANNPILRTASSACESVSQSESTSEASFSGKQMSSERMAPLAGSHKSAKDMLNELRGRMEPRQQLIATSGATPVAHVQPVTAHTSNMSWQQSATVDHPLTPIQHSHPSRSSASVDTPAKTFNSALERAYQGTVPGTGPKDSSKDFACHLFGMETDSVSDASGEERLLADRMVPLDGNHKSANDLLKELRGGAAQTQPLSKKSKVTPVSEPQTVKVSARSSAHPTQCTPATNSARPAAHDHHVTKSSAPAVSPSSCFHEALDRAVVAVDHSQVPQGDRSAAHWEAHESLPPSEPESLNESASEASTAIGQFLAERVAPLVGNHKSANDLLKELRYAGALTQQPSSVVPSSSLPPKPSHHVNGNALDTSPAAQFHGALEYSYLGRHNPKAEERLNLAQGGAHLHAPSDCHSEGDSASEASTTVEQLLADRAAPLAANRKSANDLLRELRGGPAPMRAPPLSSSSVKGMGVEPLNVDVASSAVASSWRRNAPAVPLASPQRIVWNSRSSVDVRNGLLQSDAAHSLSPMVDILSEVETDTASESSISYEQLLVDRMAPLSRNHKSARELLDEIRGLSPAASQPLAPTASATLNGKLSTPSCAIITTTSEKQLAMATNIAQESAIDGNDSPSQESGSALLKAHLEMAVPLPANFQSAGDIPSDQHEDNAPAIEEDADVSCGIGISSSTPSPQRLASPYINHPERRKFAADSEHSCAHRPSVCFQQALERSYKVEAKGQKTTEAVGECVRLISADIKALELEREEGASAASTTVEDLFSTRAAALQENSHKSAVALLKELKGEPLSSRPAHDERLHRLVTAVASNGKLRNGKGEANHGHGLRKNGVRRVYDSDGGSSSDEACGHSLLLTARALTVEGGHTSAEALLKQLKQNALAKKGLTSVTIRPEAQAPPSSASPLGIVGTTSSVTEPEQLPICDGEHAEGEERIMLPVAIRNDIGSSKTAHPDSNGHSMCKSLHVCALEQGQAKIETEGLSPGEAQDQEMEGVPDVVHKAKQDSSESEALPSAESLVARDVAQTQTTMNGGSMQPGKALPQEAKSAAVVLESDQGCPESDTAASVLSPGMCADTKRHGNGDVLHVTYTSEQLDVSHAIGKPSHGYESEVSACAEKSTAAYQELADVQTQCDVVVTETLLQEGVAGVAQQAEQGCFESEASTSAESLVARGIAQAQAKMQSGGIKSGEALLQELKSAAGVAQQAEQGCSESEASTSAESLVARAITEVQAKMQNSGIKSGEALLQELKSAAGVAQQAEQGCSESEASTSAESLVARGIAQAQAKMQNGGMKSGEALVQELKSAAGVAEQAEQGCSESEASTSAESLVARGIAQAQARMQSGGIKSGEALLQELKSAAGVVQQAEQGCSEPEASTSAESLVARAITEVQARMQNGGIKSGEDLLQELKSAAGVAQQAEHGCSESLVARAIAQAESKMQNGGIKSGEALLQELKSASGIVKDERSCTAPSAGKSRVVPPVMHAKQQPGTNAQGNNPKSGEAADKQSDSASVVEKGCSESEASTSAESLVARGIAQAQVKMRNGGVKSGEALLQEVRSEVAKCGASVGMMSSEEHHMGGSPASVPDAQGGSSGLAVGSSAGSAGKEAMMQERIGNAGASVEQIKHSRAHMSAEEMLHELKAYGSYMSRSAEKQDSAAAAHSLSPSTASVHTRLNPACATGSREGCREPPSLEDSPQHQCTLLLLKEIRDRAAITQRLMEEVSGKGSNQSTHTKLGMDCSAGAPDATSPAAVVGASSSFGLSLGQSGFGIHAGQREDVNTDVGSVPDYDTDSDLGSVTTYVSSTDGLAGAEASEGNAAEVGISIGKSPAKEVCMRDMACEERHEDTTVADQPQETNGGSGAEEKMLTSGAVEPSLQTDGGFIGDAKAELHVGKSKAVSAEEANGSVVVVDTVTMKPNGESNSSTLKEQVLFASETARKGAVGSGGGGQSSESKRGLLQELIHTATLRLREIEASRGRASSPARLEQLKAKHGGGAKGRTAVN